MRIIREEQGGVFSKILAFIGGAVVLIAIIAIASSGGGDNDNGGSSGGTADKPGQEPVQGNSGGGPAVHNFGERVKIRNGIVIIHSYDDAVPASEFFKPQNAGDHIGAIDVEQCAEGDTMSVNPLYFQVQMSDNTRRDSFSGTSKEPNLQSGDLAPGQCSRGWVSFEVPAKPAKVIYEQTFVGGPIQWTVP